jgi:hypothetical protein
MKDYSIKDIENLTEKEVKTMAIEHILIKGFDVYMVDFGGYFGYSALVFKNTRHIYYANEYELHHTSIKGNMAALRTRYINYLHGKLFTDDELLTVRNYTDYEHKNYFIRNYWNMQFNHVSMFAIGDKAIKELEEKTKEKYFSPACFCYFDSKEIADTSVKLIDNLEKEWNELFKNPVNFREAVHRELVNHEAGYTGDYEEALGALGLKWSKLTDEQKRIVNNELSTLVDNFNKSWAEA